MSFLLFRLHSELRKSFEAQLQASTASEVGERKSAEWTHLQQQVDILSKVGERRGEEESVCDR